MPDQDVAKKTLELWGLVESNKVSSAVAVFIHMFDGQSAEYSSKLAALLALCIGELFGRKRQDHPRGESAQKDDYTHDILWGLIASFATGMRKGMTAIREITSHAEDVMKSVNIALP